MATKQNEAKAKAVSPMYTVEEFCKKPHVLEVKNPDLIMAAFKTAGVKSATIDDAKAIVKKFKNKEVK